MNSAIVSSGVIQPGSTANDSAIGNIPGAVGLETLLPALMTLHHADGLPVLDLLRAVTWAPAQLMNLEGGRLARGAVADLVVFDLATPLHIEAAKLVSRSKNSPFDGRRLQGGVQRTIVAGRTVYSAA